MSPRLPIWLAGLWFFFADPRGKTYRVLGWAYLVVLAEMLTLHGKIYYMAPAYVMLLAAGCVWMEQQSWLGTKKWRKPAIVTTLFAGGAIAAPLAMPILPVKSAIRHSNFWNVQAIHVENVPQDDLPQLFGDMFGWQEQVEAVAKVYQALPAEDRSRRNPGLQLWRGQCDRLFRSAPRSAPSHVRSQSVWFLGTG